MIDCLQPVWQHFEETYTALRGSLAFVPDDKLGWSPGGTARPLAVIVQHIAKANLVYSNMIGPPKWKTPSEFDPNATRDWLLARLTESEEAVLQTFNTVTEENVNLS